ncbi:MAG: shikimate dehydrogenase [Chthoniobacterales bacterium]
MSEVFSAQNLIDGGGAFPALQPPAKLCVFGDPIAHSRSPQMQNTALKAASINAQYVRVHATAEEFPEALRALPRAGFLGANVTIPHKITALNTVDRVDDHARKIGAVNTIVVEGQKLAGYNTDGPALVRAIREEFAVDLRDLRVMIIGAGGGAGRAIAVQCALENCERLVLVNRTYEKAKTISTELESYFRSDRLIGPGERILAIPWEQNLLRNQIAQVDLLINATSIGMQRTDPSLLPGLITANLLIYDTVYATGKSPLVEDAEACGARAANGLSMLLWQGALAFEIWFNRSAPVEAMRQGLLKA